MSRVVLRDIKNQGIGGVRAITLLPAGSIRKILSSAGIGAVRGRIAVVGVSGTSNTEVTTYIVATNAIVVGAIDPVCGCALEVKRKYHGSNGHSLSGCRHYVIYY